MSAQTSGPRSRKDRDVIEVDGVVQEHSHGLYKVRCDLAGRPHFVTARAAGRLRANHVFVTVGDRVRVELGAYDLTKGRITWRHR